MQLRVEPNSNALGNTIALSQHQSIKPLTPSRSNLTSPTVLSANMKQHAPAHVNLLHNLEHPIEASKTRPLVLQNFVPPIDEPVKSHAASAFASGGFALTHFCCSFKVVSCATVPRPPTGRHWTPSRRSTPPSTSGTISDSSTTATSSPPQESLPESTWPCTS